MGMGGMGGAYATGNTFDNLKAKGELHGDLNERVARVTKKSRSMEMALKERVAEERRELDFIRDEIRSSLPQGAASRIQAQYRAIQARVQFMQLRSATHATEELKQERAAAAARRR